MELCSCPLIFACGLVQPGSRALIDWQLGGPVEVTTQDSNIAQVSVTHRNQFTYMAHILMALRALLDEFANVVEQPAEGILDPYGNAGPSECHHIHCHLLWF